MTPFIVGEIRAPLFSIHIQISAFFYQNYWSVVDNVVCVSCLDLINSHADISSINKTVITLVPKVPCPNKLTEFRPISLCMVIYKIISKVLAYRLKQVLANIIDEAQSVFVPGRQIMDNSIVAFETIHTIKRSKKKKDQIALKLDMSKAYDCLE